MESGRRASGRGAVEISRRFGRREGPSSASEGCPYSHPPHAPSARHVTKPSNSAHQLERLPAPSLRFRSFSASNVTREMLLFAFVTSSAAAFRAFFTSACRRDASACTAHPARNPIPRISNPAAKKESTSNQQSGANQQTATE